MTVLEQRGYFWWDDEAIPDGQFAPASATTGFLRISEEGSVDLELDGMLSSEHHPLKTFFDRRVPPDRSIRGLLKGSSTYALLYDLSKSGGQLRTHGISYERYHATKCLVGDRSVTTRSQLMQFKKFDIELKGFEEWLWLRAIDIERTETEFSAHYRKPDDITFPVEDGTLTIHYSLYSPWGTDSVDTLTLREAVSIIHTANGHLEFESLNELHGHISELFILLSGSNYNLDWPSLATETGEGTCKLYFQRATGESKPPGVHDWWIPFPQIRGSFGDLFTNWRAKRREYLAGFSLYLATRRGIPLYVEHRFMSLVWGIESFHRRKHASADASPNLAAKIARILSHVTPPKDHKWLEAFLEHAHEPSLERRIYEVFAALDIEFEKKSLQRFAKSCADLRNEISHFGGQRQEGDYQQFMRHLHTKSNALAYLYHALLLQEIGVDSETLRTAIYKGTVSFRMKTTLAEAGLPMISSPP